jgi:hypothetical protein
VEAREGPASLFFPFQREKSMTVKQRFCEICKAEILAERVEALPDTRRCSNCARAQEAKGNPEFDLLVSQSQLGKVGSLKKNYGDVTVKKRRRRQGE